MQEYGNNQNIDSKEKQLCIKMRKGTHKVRTGYRDRMNYDFVRKIQRFFSIFKIEYFYKVEDIPTTIKRVCIYELFSFYMKYLSFNILLNFKIKVIKNILI